MQRMPIRVLRAKCKCICMLIASIRQQDVCVSVRGTVVARWLLVNVERSIMQEAWFITNSSHLSSLSPALYSLNKCRIVASNTIQFISFHLESTCVPEFKYTCGCSTDDECNVHDCNMVCNVDKCACKTDWVYNAKSNRCVFGKSTICLLRSKPCHKIHDYVSRTNNSNACLNILLTF